MLSALVELTYNCNLDCFFCYNDTNLRGQAMELGDYERLLDQLFALGCMTLTLSGGEPLSSKHFFDVGRMAHQKNFSVRIKTNGHSMTAAIAERIKAEMNPYLVEVSLHGACAETHEKQTRLKGSFDRLMTNLPLMKAAGLRLRINSTLTSYNENEVSDMYAIADRIGVQLRFDPDVTAKDDGDQTPLSILPSKQGLINLLEAETRRMGAPSFPEEQSTHKAPKTDRHCGAGSSTIVVDPFGNVYPCVQWRDLIGNLHSSSLDEIWTGQAVNAIRNTNKDVKAWLSALPIDQRPTSFCPGMAKEQNGSPMSLSKSHIERKALYDAKSKSLRVVS